MTVTFAVRRFAIVRAVSYANAIFVILMSSMILAIPVITPISFVATVGTLESLSESDRLKKNRGMKKFWTRSTTNGGWQLVDETEAIMLTVIMVLAFAAFVVTILSAIAPPRAPLWVAVLILTLIELLRALPLGR